jgi:hypothetical protein
MGLFNSQTTIVSHRRQLSVQGVQPTGGIPFSNDPGPLVQAQPGWSLVTDYGWADNTPPGISDGEQWGSSGWANAAAVSISSGDVAGIADSPPISPARSLQMMYPIGYTGGSAPGTEYYAGFSSGNSPSQIYMGFYWKASNPWQNHVSSGINKIAQIFGGPTQGTMIPIMFWDGAKYILRLEDEINSPTVNYDPNVTVTPITLGVWHLIEVLLIQSGGLKAWLDGVLQTNQPGWTSGVGAFIQVEFAPIWGGTGETKSETDFFWYGHTRVSSAA